MCRLWCELVRTPYRPWFFRFLDLAGQNETKYEKREGPDMKNIPRRAFSSRHQLCFSRCNRDLFPLFSNSNFFTPLVVFHPAGGFYPTGVFSRRWCFFTPLVFFFHAAPYPPILSIHATAIETAGGNGASLLHVPDRTTIATSRGGPANGHGTSGAGAAVAEAERRAALYGGDGGIPPPPRSLMAFPPVARLLNLVLTSFNQLREVGKCFILFLFLWPWRRPVLV